jgi:hypothetical protein
MRGNARMAVGVEPNDGVCLVRVGETDVMVWSQMMHGAGVMIRHQVLRCTLERSGHRHTWWARTQFRLTRPKVPLRLLHGQIRDDVKRPTVFEMSFAAFPEAGVAMRTMARAMPLGGRARTRHPHRGA